MPSQEELQARALLSNEQREWLDSNGFRWSTALPLSHASGWTNLRCSFIFKEGIGLTESIFDMNYRLKILKF